MTTRRWPDRRTGLRNQNENQMDNRLVEPFGTERDVASCLRGTALKSAVSNVQSPGERCARIATTKAELRRYHAHDMQVDIRELLSVRVPSLHPCIVAAFTKQGSEPRRRHNCVAHTHQERVR